MRGWGFNMAGDTNLDDLMEICRKYYRKAPPGVVFKEPYIPYVPKPWNGVLVLAEAQNISSSDDEYAKRLRSLSRDASFKRLGHWRGDIGIGPWDGGYAKLALKAMLPTIAVERTAVSNAVPWTKREREGKNANPDDDMIELAAEFWEELLSAWKPEIRLLVVLGNVAKYVMDEARALDKYVYVKLRLPSQRAMYQVSGLFDPDDLKRRYPEVGRAVEALGMTGKKEPDDLVHQFFFACHAVSLGRDKCKAVRLS